jgi:hypothetical protein
MRSTAKMRSTAAATEVGPAEASPTSNMAASEMTAATAEVGTTATEVRASTNMAAASTVRCSAAMTSATPAAPLRRRISGGSQNGHQNENDQGSKFCHDYSIDLAD